MARTLVRSKRLEIRMSPDERARLQRAADRDKVPLGPWLIEAGDLRSKRAKAKAGDGK